ncbi:TetR/AcrR family transcriptional regulator [Nocardiopsis sp. RSe5-2]|uniref:TetR/AcrR family transcriptional regulator n=1 Tax=Nocardiopsis endophytica TaxID=3018445 RepID=A0ABT4U5M9_9ACTN|nr:TetR/AcrR family transcriptional regulator [Nocardiopsis endophytica]MDA2811745.1 TetR/AcrR family transcriptional regulator [Nocardiopsis endophytica]
MPYHHGDLRRTLLAAAADAVAESGAAAVSLRELARRAGVSNAAPTHHFGDKAGLLTALAAEGYGLLADTVTRERLSGGGIVGMGVAYVRFALDHPGHFEVMFHPALYRADDEELSAARARAADALAAGVTARPGAGGGDAGTAGVAAWSLVHGYATLVLAGAVRTDDPQAQARAIARLLFPDDAP